MKTCPPQPKQQSNQPTRPRQRVNAIRSQWTPEERDGRARLARLRQVKLWKAITGHDEPEVWAVGAVSASDLSRLAG